MNNEKFFIYLLVMAGVTYLLRAVPLLLIKKRIKNRYVLAFMHYIPYSVLTVMTVPAIFYVTANPVTGVIGLIAAVVLTFIKNNLVFVAAGTSFIVIISEMVITYLL